VCGGGGINHVCDAGLQLSAAAEENQAVLRTSGAATEKRKGGAGVFDGRQILEEQNRLKSLDVGVRGQLAGLHS
jgi:hypothetical protein